MVNGELEMPWRMAWKTMRSSIMNLLHVAHNLYEYRNMPCVNGIFIAAEFRCHLFGQQASSHLVVLHICSSNR